MNTNQPDVGIIYYKNTFDAVELAELEQKMAYFGLKLIARERTPYVNASIDFFVPLLQIMLSPDMALALYEGVLTNMAYDGIKQLLIRIYHKFSKKNRLKNPRESDKRGTCQYSFYCGQQSSCFARNRR